MFKCSLTEERCVDAQDPQRSSRQHKQDKAAHANNREKTRKKQNSEQKK